MDKQYKSALPFVMLVANAVLGSLYFGYAISYLNPATNSYPIYYHIYDFSSSTQNVLKALVGSLFTLAAGGGAMLSGTLLSQFSIRQSFMITDLIGISGVLLELVPNVYVFLVARIIIGLCVGLNSSLVPQYIKEFSPSNLSGPLGALNQLTINVGVLFGLISAFFYQSVIGNSDINNKTLVICLELPIAICAIRTTLLMVVFRNEPPSYYVQQQEITQATQVIQQYYNQSSVNEVLEKIKQTQESKKLNKEAFGDLFRVPTSRKKLFIGCGLQMLQQFSGINAIMFFSGIIFSSILNDDTKKINWANTFVGVINIIFSIIAVQLLQKSGRRPLLLWGTLVCSIFLGVAFGFSFDQDPNTLIQIFVVVAIFGYLAAFQLSLGPVAWIYDADILSEKGMSIAVLCNWVSCSIIAFAFVILDIQNNQERLTWVFGVFTGCCSLGILFIAKFVRETKDRTQSAIDLMFSLVNAKDAGLLG